MITVIIADDHIMFRQGLVNLLRTVSDIEIVAECDDGAEAMERIMSLRPDVAVLDITMPGKSGVDVIRLLTEAGSRTRTLLLTMHDDPEMCDAAFAAGACGYVLKGEAFDELVHAIRDVAVGSRVVSHKLKQYYDASSTVRPAKLSKRETQILTLIARGFTNRMIATELKISVKTVESHRENIISKLDVHSAVEMTRYALKAGLV